MRVSFSRCLCKCTKVCRCTLGMLWIMKLSRVQLYLIEAVVFIWSIYEADRNVLQKPAAGRARCWTQGLKTALFLYLSHDDGMIRFSSYHPSTLKDLFWQKLLWKKQQILECCYHIKICEFSVWRPLHFHHHSSQRLITSNMDQFLLYSSFCQYLSLKSTSICSEVAEGSVL